MAMNGNGPGPLDLLLRCEFGNIGPLYVTKWQDAGDTQGLARFMLPEVDYMVAQPVGLDTHVVRGQMVFLTSLGDRDLFPTRYIEMRRAVRKPEPQIFIHPMDGRMMGYLTQFESSWDADTTLNGCVVSFQFERVNEDAPFRDLDLISKNALITAETAAAVADAALQQLGLPMPADALGGLSAQLLGLRSLIDSSPLVSEITSYMANYRTIVDQLVAYRELGDPANFEVFRAVRTASSRALDAANEAASRAPRIINVPALKSKITPVEASVWIYKDPNSVDDIISLNPPHYFFYPRGTILQVPDL